MLAKVLTSTVPLIWFIFATSSKANDKVSLGKSAPEISLDSDDGGLVAGGVWKSTQSLGKVSALLYVDPDEEKTNKPFQDALEREKFPEESFSTLAVINMGASWLPNGLINMRLDSYQEKFPQVTYVKDLRKTLVAKWRIADDSYNVLIFDRKGLLIFFREGKMSTEDITSAVDLIRRNL